MIGALILLGIVIVVGVILYVSHRLSMRNEPDEAEPEEETPASGQVCCGMHLVCEKDLPVDKEGKIVYYDDEELDRLADTDPATYTDDDIEQFRDILLTLLPEDIAGWNKSLELRHIALPPAVHDEMLMIVSEMRQTLNAPKQ